MRSCIMFAERTVTFFCQHDCDILQLNVKRGSATPINTLMFSRALRRKTAKKLDFIKTRPWNVRIFRLPELLDSRQMKVVRPYAQAAFTPPPQRKIVGAHLCLRLSRPQGHSAAGRVK